MFYFSITIDGFSDKIEDVKILQSNLDTEIAGFEWAWISDPKIIAIPHGELEAMIQNRGGVI